MMKKGGEKVHEEQGIRQLQINTSDDYPDRLRCYIKLKLTSTKANIDEAVRRKDDFNVKGTGCLLSRKYVVTAAHILLDKERKMKELDNKNCPFIDESYIKQGLGIKNEGDEQKYICKLEIKQTFINPGYKKVYNDQAKSIQEDFGLLEINPDNPLFKEEKFMPIVHLSNESIKSIRKIFVFGYGINFNISKASDKNNSSVYMNFPCGGSNEIKAYEKVFITYSIPTEKGVSGAPIITYFQNQPIIIGIHKGVETGPQGLLTGKGVSAAQMMRRLNERGYQLEKKPFVYTQKTLKYYQNQTKLTESQILFLTQQGLEASDILVITSFDLTKLKRLLLSGNSIGNLGVQFILQRHFPNITSIHLTQNRIDDLRQIPEENWSNIQNVRTISFNFNQLKTLPEGIMRLTNLQKLWITNNQFKQIPEVIERYCKQNDKEALVVDFFDNLVNLEQNKHKIEEFATRKAKIVWSRQGEQKRKD